MPDSTTTLCSLARTHVGLNVFLTALLAFVAATPALSNDGYGELGLGGIVSLGKTNAVRMQKEVLEVSYNKIRVDYVFERNISLLGDKQSFPVLFPLPLYSAETPSWSWAGAPQGFSVTVNGQRQAFKTAVTLLKSEVFPLWAHSPG